MLNFLKTYKEVKKMDRLFRHTPNAIYIPKRSTVIKNKIRRKRRAK